MIDHEELALVKRLRERAVRRAVNSKPKVERLIIDAADEIERLRDALEPFARLYCDHHHHLPDNQPIFGIQGYNILVGDMRKAHALINPTPHKQSEGE